LGRGIPADIPITRGIERGGKDSEMSLKRREFLRLAAASPLLFLPQPSRAEPLPNRWCVVGDVGTTSARVAFSGYPALEVAAHVRSLQTRLETVKPSLLTGGAVHQFDLNALPPDAQVEIRAGSQVMARFQTPSVEENKRVRFLWGGDVVGQGWGIGRGEQSMITFASMRAEAPHFFIHCGDSIYADDPVAPKKTMLNGSVWSSLVTPSKMKAATSLADFRGHYSYNFLDRHYRDFFREVPVIAQWDDHEVLNNWSPSRHGSLAAPALRAFLDYWPVRAVKGQGLYRKISYGPNLDLFVLDLRSFRGPNSENRQVVPGPESKMMGRAQLDWLKQGLVRSKATWKIVAGEMPLSTYSPRFGLDNWANGPGPPLGREHELKELFQHLKRHNVGSVVWLSADVHYAMAIRYEPKRAVFQNFNPFWEFIAGPLHAGTFSPQGDLDPTFGAVEEFCSVPRSLNPNRPPSDGLQFYGRVDVEKKRLTVTLHQREGREIYRQEILPQ